MSAVTGNALKIGYRFMLYLKFTGGGFHVLMAGETDPARLISHEPGIIRAMRAMTGHTVSFGKRRMGAFIGHSSSKLLVTGKAEFAACCTCLEKGTTFAAMGAVT